MITTTTKMLERALRACLVISPRAESRPNLAGVMVEGGAHGIVYTATDGHRLLRIRIASSQPACRIVIPRHVAQAILGACVQHREDNTDRRWDHESETYQDMYAAYPVTIEEGLISLPGIWGMTFKADADLQTFMDNGGDPKPGLWEKILPPVRDEGGLPWQGVTVGYLGDIGPIMKALGGDALFSLGRLQLGDGVTVPIRFDSKDYETEVAYALMPLAKYDKVEAGERLLDAGPAPEAEG